MKNYVLLLSFILMAGCRAPAPNIDANSAADKAEVSSKQASEFLSANGTTISLSELDLFIDQQMETLSMPGVSIAVISDGKIIYNRAKGIANLATGKAVDDKSIFESASLSKPVFAYFALRLVDKGVLDLDKPLHEYLPMKELEYDPRYHQVTARMALSHTTGFPNWRWFDPAPAERNIERGQMYMKYEPGTFGYSGEGYNYLAMVIASLTQNDLTTLDTLFQEEVARPLGMTHSAFVKTEFVAAHKVMGHKNGEVSDEGWPRSFPDDTPQTFGAAGRLHSHALDYARFMTALMKGEGLSPALSAEMLKPQSDIPEGTETRKLTGDTSWGLGIAIEPTPHGTRYEHGGNNGDFQSGMMFFKDKELGYVFMTNSDRGAEFNRVFETYMSEGG